LLICVIVSYNPERPRVAEALAEAQAEGPILRTEPITPRTIPASDDVNKIVRKNVNGQT
jgi:hypothetical protein